MTKFDYAIIAIISISVLLGLWRGFIKEILSILIWAIAFGVAIWFAPDMMRYCQNLSSNHDMQATAAFLILFFLALVGGMLLHLLLMTIVDQTDFSIMNRILGGLFGLVRGCIFALIVVMLLSFTSLKDTDGWKKATLLPTFEAASTWIQDFLINNAPQNIVKVLKQVKDIKANSLRQSDSDAKDLPVDSSDGLEIKVIEVKPHHAPISALS